MDLEHEPQVEYSAAARGGDWGPEGSYGETATSIQLEIADMVQRLEALRRENVEAGEGA